MRKKIWKKTLVLTLIFALVFAMTDTGTSVGAETGLEGEETPTPTPEETATPTPEAGEETPTPTPEAGEETPTPTPEAGEETPTPTPEEGEETPTPTPEAGEETPTPTPEAGEETATPTPEAGEETATPTPEAGEETATPTPEAGEETATPTPEAGEETATPTPEAGEETATPTPEVGEETPTPTPTPEETATPTPEPIPEDAIFVSPFAGLWKYFGQTRPLIRDIHYGVSNDAELPDGLSLGIASEEVGQQPYVLNDTRPENDPYYTVTPGAPTYEIRAYHTNATAEGPTGIVNIEDKETLVGGNVISVTAPTGYKISKSIGEDAAWGTEILVELVDGRNEVTYYLSSNLDDETKKAIDQTQKTLIVTVDWVAPGITALTAGDNSTDTTADGAITGSESGKFYYIVIPRSVAEEEESKAAAGVEGAGITTSYIENRVASHYGIVGYGRVDGVKATDISFAGLAAETEYVLYSYIVDDAGNVSPVVKSESFVTDRTALTGEVTISGTVDVNQTLTAKATIDSISPGTLSYQWYRVKNNADTELFESVLDETGGEEEDDLEADEDGDEEEDSDDSDTSDGDGIYVLDSVNKLAETSDDDTETVTVDGATLIKDATSATYKATNADIGYRLICQVTAANYSGYIAGESSTFVPKLIPQFTKPVIASRVYSPTKTLASIALPQRYTWVDNTIVPVYGNSGYRVKYVPQDTAKYRTVIVRVKVPIQKKALTKKMISLKKKYSYTGKAIKDNFDVEDGDELLESGKDYKATYKNNKKLGKATVTIKGIGNYKGTKKVTYKIVKRSVKSLKYSYKKSKWYSGKAKTPGVKVKNGSVKLVKNKDYTIAYRNNVLLGTATIQIKGKGNYCGKKKLTFKIIPSKPKITKVKKKKTSFKIKLSAGKIAKGYNVYVSTSSSFAKKKTQQYTTTGNSFGVQGLSKGTYYVRVKCYGTRKGKTYKSSYSKVRKIKIK